MSKRTLKLIIVVALGWAGSASAALLPPVTVNGQQWLQPIDFVDHSWNDIASVCDANTGACNGSLGGHELTGWTWAGIPELHALFTAFGIPHFTGSDPNLTMDVDADSPWAPLFLEMFQPTYHSIWISGLLRTTTYDSVTGIVANDYGTIGLVVDAAQTVANRSDKHVSSGDLGGWFYRTAVPTPATILLLGLGLAALGASRLKRKPA